MSFQEVFWSTDYSTGILSLLNKLDQGCQENNQLLALIADRIAVEQTYANALLSAPHKHAPSKQAYGHDEGATAKLSYLSLVADIAKQGQIHENTASELEDIILIPFDKWSAEHRSRVNKARKDVLNSVKEYEKKYKQTLKSQSLYFSKCRQLEDTDPAKRHASDETAADHGHEGSAPGSPSSTSSGLVDGLQSIIEGVRKRSDSGTVSAATGQSLASSLMPNNLYTLGGAVYPPGEMLKVLKSAQSECDVFDYKIPIVGTYPHVSAAEDMVLWMRKYLHLKNVAEAERFGQSLVDYNFIRPVGVGVVGKKRFTSSTNSYYQWTNRALNATVESLSTPKDDPPYHTEVPKKTSPLSKMSTTNQANQAMKSVNNFVSGLMNIPVDVSALKEEIQEADERYYTAVIELDKMRCSLEAEISDTLNFMQQCELDRLRATRQVFKDFGRVMAGYPNSYLPLINRFALDYQSVNPQADLKYIIESYQTGAFQPKVVVYENFYKRVPKQSFGVDLAQVPFIVPAFTDYLTWYAGNTKARVRFAEQVMTAPEKPEDTTPDRETADVADQSTPEKIPDTKEDSEAGEANNEVESTAENKDSQAAADPTPTTPPQNVQSDADEAPVTTSTSNNLDFSVLYDVWMANINFSDIHELRAELNTGQAIEDPMKTFKPFSIKVVAATLREFLIELPDSVISFTLYDVLRKCYSESQRMAKDAKKAKVVSILASMPKINVVTLETIVDHLSKIAAVINGEELLSLCGLMGPILLRHRSKEGRFSEERVGSLLLLDLISNKAEFFTSIYSRMEMASREARNRSLSTSEANRRAYMEARNRSLQQQSPPTNGKAITATGLLPLTLSPSREQSRSRDKSPGRTRNGIISPKLVVGKSASPQTSPPTSPSNSDVLAASSSPPKEKELPAVPTVSVTPPDDQKDTQ